MIMTIKEIMEYLPHRYPFLLVDRVTEAEKGQFIKGYKNISLNEPFFNGHFPNNPIMPGVLIIEAMAQLSGILGFLTVGRRYLYHPKLSRERCVREESRTFAERVFGGETSPLLVRMVREADLSQDEIDELRRVLGEKEEE